MGIEEPFSYKKFLSGLVSPLNFAKSFVFLCQASLILILILCVLFTSLWLKNKFFKKKTQSGTVTVTNMSGGCIHNSTDEFKKKFGLINLW